MKPESTGIDMLAIDDDQDYIKLGRILIDDESEKAVLATYWFYGNGDSQRESILTYLSPHRRIGA